VAIALVTLLCDLNVKQAANGSGSHRPVRIKRYPIDRGLGSCLRPTLGYSYCGPILLIAGNHQVRDYSRCGGTIQLCRGSRDRRNEALPQTWIGHLPRPGEGRIQVRACPLAGGVNQ
jgi:hypothetical protein